MAKKKGKQKEAKVEMPFVFTREISLEELFESDVCRDWKNYLVKTFGAKYGWDEPIDEGEFWEAITRDWPEANVEEALRWLDREDFGQRIDGKVELRIEDREEYYAVVAVGPEFDQDIIEVDKKGGEIKILAHGVAENGVEEAILQREAKGYGFEVKKLRKPHFSIPTKGLYPHIKFLR